MAKTDDYLKRYNETNQNDLVKPAETAGEDDYFKLAREQEYGLLFDKEVALENAKANALKYTKNEINAQGFGGTGYGSSMQSGIYNSYLNRANEAKEQYADRIREIGVEEREKALADANDRFQSVTTMVQGADTLENMNQILTDYGYGSVDETGSFKWNAEKPEGMSDDDWYQMQYYYRMKENDFAKQAEEEAEAEQRAKLPYMTSGEKAKYYEDKAFGDGGEIKSDIDYARYSYHKMQDIGFYVQGLGSGRDNDDVDITIGSTTRDGDKEYDLVVKGEVSRDLNNVLNACADNAMQKGDILVYKDALYIFVGDKWKQVQGDRDDVKDCINDIKKHGLR